MHFYALCEICVLLMRSSQVPPTGRNDRGSNTSRTLQYSNTFGIAARGGPTVRRVFLPKCLPHPSGIHLPSKGIHELGWKHWLTTPSRKLLDLLVEVSELDLVDVGEAACAWAVHLLELLIESSTDA